MPYVCAASGCSNRSNRERTRRYFRVPKVVVHKSSALKELTGKRRQQWISNLRRRSAESANARVCSDHFVKGCPSSVHDIDDVDWAPTVNLGDPTSQATRLREKKMEKSKNKKQQHTEVLQGAEALLALRKSAESPESDQITGNLGEQQVNAGCQTDLTMDDIETMEDVLKQTTTELGDLRAKALDTEFSQESFQKNEEKTKFYTGLPNVLCLMQVFQMCEPYITCGPSALSKFEQFLLVLLRLRLNFPLQDLASSFKVSHCTASQIWHTVVDTLHERLEFLIEWPERDELEATMPVAFRHAFGCKVAMLVDCFEVFIERPSDLPARALTSNRKHHHAVKFLIGMAPHGVVSFISSAWGGRVSDKQITEESGILNKLLPGDIVLADRGFSVGDSGLYCASLQMPSFMKGKNQLSPYEAEQTRKFANVRINVEKLIGLVQRKYQILQSRALPITNMATKPGESLSMVDKIGVICCALSNLSLSVVPLE